jgi:hypothetical protein
VTDVAAVNRFLDDEFERKSLREESRDIRPPRRVTERVAVRRGKKVKTSLAEWNELWT